MNKIIDIISIDCDLVDEDGVTHYIATAVLEDVYKVRTSLLDPAEWRPGQCSSAFKVEAGEDHPPQTGNLEEVIAYLDGHSLEWRRDD